MFQIDNKIWMKWLRAHLGHCILLCCTLLPASCGLQDGTSLPETSAVHVTVKSATEAGTDINIWAYACDADGNVVMDTPEAYVSSDGSDALLQFSPLSRYYLIATVANAGMTDAALPFSSLSTASVSTADPDVASHWTVVDMMPDGGLKEDTDLQMDVFRTVGKVSVSVAKSSESMRLLVTDVSVCSASAPTEGALLSSLTPAQIRNGGRDSEQWWSDGFTPERAAFSETLAEDTEVAETDAYVPAGSMYVFENQDGWTDLTAFEAENFASDPSDSGNGYYLSVTYRYCVLPDVALDGDSPLVTEVRKYVPLAPVCRANAYDIKIAFDMDTITVTGSTEVSEETEGVW